MKYIFSIALFLIFQFSFSQVEIQKIDLTFNNSTIKEVLLQIEDKTNYHFYFSDDWLSNDPISGNYVNAGVEEILADLFDKTQLNFFIFDERQIILTQNNIIYDELPEGFFGETREVVISSETDDGNRPVFNEEVKTETAITVETVRIGKESRNKSQTRFTLDGFARNSVTGEPIPNLALVVIGKNRGTVTDSRGYFEIDLEPGSNLIEASSLGFENIRKRVIIYNDGRLNFDLNEEYEGLEEVVVRSDVDRNVEEANTGVTKINVKVVKNIPLVLGERDILKVATTLPGISTAGEGSSGYNVRGGKTDQNLILLDDAVMYNPAHFFGIFSAVNPYTTGDVNIYKGNIPAEYGGRLSSVFDIETKDPNLEKFSGEASIGPVTANLALEVPLTKEKSSILLGGRSTFSDWILKTLDEEELKKSKANFFDVITKFHNKIDEKNDLKATAYFSRDVFSITSDSVYSYNNRLMSLRWDHKFNEKNKGSVVISNSQYKFNIEFDGSTDNNFELGYRINETELKLNMKYLHSKAHRFDYGVSGKLYNVDPGNKDPLDSQSNIVPVSIPEERALESAIYVSDEFEVNDKLLINAGIRYSFYASLGASDQRVYAPGLPKNEGTVIDTLSFKKNEFIETYSGPEVRLSARYFLTPDFSMKGSYNSAYQYIHTLSNNTTVSPTDVWKLSDLNIEPQRADQFSLGLYKNFDGGEYELSVEGYYKKTDNIIDYKVGAQLLLNEAIETEVLQGEGKAYGIEFLVRKVSGRLNGWLGYTYSRAFNKLESEFAEERVNDGDFFPANYDKPHDVSLVMNYKLTKRFSLSANVIYQTGRPVTVPVGNFIINDSEFVLYSDRNKYRIPDYFRVDLGLNIEGNHKIKKFAHSFWNISVYNVFGRNNPYSVFFVTENGEVKAKQSSIFKVPVPTITYNFKF
jgi:hypothetical protein